MGNHQNGNVARLADRPFRCPRPEGHEPAEFVPGHLLHLTKHAGKLAVVLFDRLVILVDVAQGAEFDIAVVTGKPDLISSEPSRIRSKPSGSDSGRGSRNLIPHHPDGLNLEMLMAAALLPQSKQKKM